MQPKFRPATPSLSWRYILVGVALMVLLLGTGYWLYGQLSGAAPEATSATQPLRTTAPESNNQSLVNEQAMQPVSDSVSLASQVSEKTMLYVDVKGAVAKPGVYQLPAGSRVLDALEAAGGLLPEAELNSLNRAQLLQDQQALYVYTQAEWTSQASQQPVAMQGLNGVNSVTGRAEYVQTNPALVNINQATAEQLQQLPGIGAKKAEAIIQYRQEHGEFKQVADLTQVSGIGPKLLKKIEELVTVQ